jgi:hypothetical protein
MEKGWTPLISSNSPSELQVVKGMLEVHGIAAVIMNKRDSSYLSFGDGTLYVKNMDFIKAKNLIDSQEPAD